MIYYKTTNANGQGFNRGKPWSLPKDGKPGDWMPRVKEVIACESGYHLCRKKDVIHWLDEAIWTVETKGQVYRFDDKVAVHEARLASKIETWTHEIQCLVMAEWANHVLPNFERYYSNDTRPRDAITALYRHALGEIDLDELRAADSAAWSAEQNWQTKILFQYLNRPISESLEIAREKIRCSN